MTNTMHILNIINLCLPYNITINSVLVVQKMKLFVIIVVKANILISIFIVRTPTVRIRNVFIGLGANIQIIHMQCKNLCF